jgi:hypothetical protein
MSYGYSVRLSQLNKEADDTLIGVRLGRLCIACNRPVSSVAVDLGVTRQTVYNWFSGSNAPQSQMVSAVEAYLATLTP